MYTSCASYRSRVPSIVRSSSCRSSQAWQRRHNQHSLGHCWLLLVLTASQQLRPPWTAVYAKAGSVLPASAWRQANKTCDPGCLQFGNCNAEFGTCECPFGMSGPMCSFLAFPACRTSTAPGAPMYYGVKYPKNCECFEQLRSQFCVAAAECDLLGLRAWGEMRCFRKIDAPAAEQLSDLPQHNDTSYSWFLGLVKQGKNGPEVRTLVPYPRHPSEMEPHELVRSGTPLDNCPDRCHDHGWCKGTKCQCHIGWSGLSCNVAIPSACTNSCSGRGRCEGLFCHCSPPYFGPACERSLGYEAVPGMQHVPQLAKLKIYMYSLPAEVASNTEFDDGWGDVYIIYQAFTQFQRMLLADTLVWTENPYEANLFFIPSFAYYPTGNLADPTARVYRAVQYVQQNFPWFNASGGHDHFVWLTADRGACHLNITHYPVLEPVIKITHFGLSAANLTSKQRGYVADSVHGCHKPSRDIVAAPYFAPNPRLIQATMKDIESGGLNRDLLFAFAGDVRKDQPEYSGGVRQTLADLLAAHDFPDVIFKGGYRPLTAREYEELLKRSKFCLAPYGHGWGIRVTHALMHGCVPVIIQDHVYQPYEDLLPYEDFSIRIAKRELPQMVDILRAVPVEEVVRMRRNMAKVYRAFIWQPERGGLAYNYTIASLRKRMYTMQSLLGRQRHWKLQGLAGLQRAHAGVRLRSGVARP